MVSENAADGWIALAWGLALLAFFIAVVEYVS